MPVSSGRNWSIEGDVLDLFGIKGCKIGAKTFLGYHTERLVATHLEEVGPKINANLIYTLSKQVKECLTLIGVSEYIAFALYFEQILTPGALEAAEEDMNTITAKVMLGGSYRTILIREHPPRDIMYLGPNGEDLNP